MVSNALLRSIETTKTICLPSKAVLQSSVILNNAEQVESFIKKSDSPS